MASLVDAKKKYCYIDFDINDARASYRRACDFVEKNSIKYGLSSNKLRELGGREVLSIAGLVANDFQYSKLGTVRVKPQKCCRIVFEMFTDISPLACENFQHLCTGSKGKSKSSGIQLHYKGSNIHRIVPGFIIQGGDIIFSNGTGGGIQDDTSYCIKFVLSLLYV